MKTSLTIFAIVAGVFAFKLVLADTNGIVTNTTTIRPKPETTTTTTPKPQTTTNTTTPKPETTTITTPKPDTTTPNVTTTTIKPTTPKPEPKPELPEIVEYAITKTIDNKTYNCFMGKFKTEISLKYNNTFGKVVTGYLSLLNTSIVDEDSLCGENKTKLVIRINDLSKDTLTLLFVNKDNKTYSLSNVTLNLDPKTISEHIPDAPHETNIHADILNGDLFSSPISKSYLCKLNITKEMIGGGEFNVSISMSDVQFDVFRKLDNGNEYREAQECDGDDEFSDIVPIAVGAALAALVVIVLIAYFIGRRRSRQMSYQSV